MLRLSTRPDFIQASLRPAIPLRHFPPGRLPTKTEVFIKMPLIEAAFFGDQLQIDRVYSPEQKIKLKQHCSFRSPSITLNNFHEYRRELENVQVIFSTWTMPRLENHHLDMMPNLKAVFFAAGSVKSFAEPLWDKGIIIVSAWKVNCHPDRGNLPLPRSSCR